MTKVLMLAGVLFAGWGFVAGNARAIGLGVALLAVGAAVRWFVHWWRYRP